MDGSGPLTPGWPVPLSLRLPGASVACPLPRSPGSPSGPGLWESTGSPAGGCHGRWRRVLLRTHLQAFSPSRKVPFLSKQKSSFSPSSADGNEAGELVWGFKARPPVFLRRSFSLSLSCSICASSFLLSHSSLPFCSFSSFLHPHTSPFGPNSW